MGPAENRFRIELVAMVSVFSLGYKILVRSIFVPVKCFLIYFYVSVDANVN